MFYFCSIFQKRDKEVIFILVQRARREDDAIILNEVTEDAKTEHVLRTFFCRKHGDRIHILILRVLLFIDLEYAVEKDELF